MRAIALLLAVGLALPATASAAGPAEADEEAGPEYEEARQLYEEGRGFFETADYLAAIEAWTEAYNLLPSTPTSARIKTLLIYDIATARELAFEVDNEVSHLRQAKILLENFDANIEQLYSEDETEAIDAERSKVEQRMAKLDAQIEAANDAPQQSGGEPEPKPGTPGERDVPPHKPLVISGATLLALGVVGLGVMAGGLVMGSQANDLSGVDDTDIDGRRDQFDRGRTGNVMAYTGGAVGGALAVTGAVLLAIGLRRRSSATAFAPVVGPGLTGLTLQGRF